MRILGCACCWVGVLVMSVVVSAGRWGCRCPWRWGYRCCCTRRWRSRRNGRRRRNPAAEAGDGGSGVAHVRRALGPHHRDVARILRRAVISCRSGRWLHSGGTCSTWSACGRTGVSMRGRRRSRSRRRPVGAGGRRPLLGRLGQEVQSAVVHCRRLALCCRVRLTMALLCRKTIQRWHG